VAGAGQDAPRHHLLLDRRAVGRATEAARLTLGRGRGAVVAQPDTWAASPVSVPFYEQRMRYARRAFRMQKT
jgi:hypothetical protein